MRKFVIFGLGRNGSTLLANLLNAVPTIHCDGELFNRDHWQTGIRRRLLAMFRRYPMPYISFRQSVANYYRRASGYGFKLQFGQLDQSGHRLRQLHEADWHILYLWRQSVFAQVISAYVAKQTRFYHSWVNQADPEIKQLSIAPEDFLKLYKSRQRRIQQCHDLFSTLPHLPLVYKRDLQSSQQWQGTVSNICEVLGLDAPSLSVTSNLRKTWRQPYSEMIENYAELLELARQEGE